MFDSVIFLEKIIIEPPAAKIYSRLGFKKKITSLSSFHRQETDHHIEEAASIIRLQGSFVRLPIRKNDGQDISLDEQTKFSSAKLSVFLGGCREAVLLGATAGHPIMEAIREKTNRGDLTAAVVYDATASEMADAALDWMMTYINRQLRREGRQLLSRRFSAGYADFALENQKIIHEKLQLAKINVSITPSFILLPEKSVTAISGIA
ncbi:MAG: cytoplasmic protein [Syntrophaceae bacterium]|nr:MAG: cytoplasmic protein [Syntrophaceae bacterium]